MRKKTAGGAAAAVAGVVLLICLTAGLLMLQDTNSQSPPLKVQETRGETKRKRETVEQEQIEILNSIYSSLNGGSGWTYSTNWGTENDPCSPQTPWYGVSCIVEGTQSVIQEIDLSDNNVSGSFPPNTLQLLSSLRFLYVNDNSISGALPIDVFNGTKLTKFIAGNNQMKGTLPETIGSLNGTLQWLDLSNNLLSGSIPDSLWSCLQLQGLLLNGNGRPNTGSQGLTGTISEKIGQLQQLTVFHADQNHLSGTLPLGLFQLPLTELFLGSNQIQGEVPDQIGQLRGTLERLDLSATIMSGTLPSTLFDLSLLQYLNLGLSRFVGPVSEEIGSLRGLQQLNLRSSPSSPFSFNGSLPSSIWSLSDLQFLYLSNNRFTGSIGLVSNLTQLQVLDVSSNELNGSLSDAQFQGLGQMTTLLMNNNRLHGTVPSAMGSMVNMTNLDMHANQLSGFIPSSLEALGSQLISKQVLSYNPFVCPLESWQMASPFSASCDLWTLSSLWPQFVPSQGGVSLFFSGKNYQTALGNVYCEFGPDPGLNPEGKALLTTATITSSTEGTCEVPAHPPTAGTNYTVDLVYWDPLSSSSPRSLLDGAPLQPLLYVATPSVVSLDPSSSPSYGGGVLHLFGSDFAPTDQWDQLLCRFMFLQSSPSSSFDLLLDDPLLLLHDLDFIPQESSSSSLDQNEERDENEESLWDQKKTIQRKQTLQEQEDQDQDEEDLQNEKKRIQRRDTLQEQEQEQEQDEGQDRVGQERRNRDHKNFFQRATASSSLSTTRSSTKHIQRETEMRKRWKRMEPITTEGTYINNTYITCTIPEVPSEGIWSVEVSNGNGSYSTSGQTIQYFAWCPPFNGSLCDGHGDCLNSTGVALCVCNASYSGANCSDCLPSFFGPDCDPCPDCGPHGSCDQGEKGTGRCKCEWEWAGSGCRWPWLYITGIGLVVSIIVFLSCSFLWYRMVCKTRSLPPEEALPPNYTPAADSLAPSYKEPLLPSIQVERVISFSSSSPSRSSPRKNLSSSLKNSFSPREGVSLHDDEFYEGVGIGVAAGSRADEEEDHGFDDDLDDGFGSGGPDESSPFFNNSPSLYHAI